MEARLEEDEQLQADYRNAHEHFLKERNAMEDLGTDFSGGGMPDRVKCLHVLIAYALGEGREHFRFGTVAVGMAADHGKLRGSAIPQDWPTNKELGIDLDQFDFSNA